MYFTRVIDFVGDTQVVRLSKEGAASKALATKVSAEKDAQQETHSALAANKTKLTTEVASQPVQWLTLRMWLTLRGTHR